MSIFRQIHWHEGLFLQPHHLQRFQKGILDLAAAERRLTTPYPYGIISMEMSSNALRRFDVEFTHLHAIMPSGLEVCFNVQTGAGNGSAESNSELPSLNLRPAMAGGAKRLSIYLAVPKWSPQQPNSVSMSRRDLASKVRYDFQEEDCSDENTGQNSSRILFRRLRARLVLSVDEAPDCETLELLRVRPVVMQGASIPQLDFDFVPPLFSLGGSPQLCQRLLDLTHDLGHVRDSTANKIRNAGYTADNLLPGQLLKILRLKILNQHLGSLKPYLQAALEGRAVQPFPLYLQLKSMLGELASLRIGVVEFEAEHPQGSELYQHDDPWPSFDLLVDRIRDFLDDQDEEKPLEAEFAALSWNPFGLVANLTEEHLLKPNAWYLGIRTEADPDKLYAYVQNSDRFRLLPAEMVEQGILVPGIPLVKPRVIPSILPGFSNLHYFKLDIQNSPAGRWDEIKNQHKIAIARLENEQREVGVDLSGATFTLFMTLPPQAAKS